MKIQVENVSPVERKVSIEVDPDRVAQELERAYAGLGRRVKLRGFRPGKAPRKVLERQFRAEVESEVLEKIVQQTFAEAVKVESLPLVAPPHVSVSEGVADGKPIRYTARVEVKPAIAPKDYRGLEVTRKAPEVTDQMVSDELSRLQDSLAQLVPVEGRFEAQEDDWAVIDHEGTIDGKPFEGGKAEGVTVKVAPGAISDGNLEALKGKKLGETVELDEPFPEDHRVEQLRGKTAHMKVTLKALKTRQLPALDDALAKEAGVEGIETLDALRARIRADLEKREKRRAESEVKDALVKAALAKNEFEVPPALVERAIDSMLEGAAERFARSGIDIRRLELDFAKMRADMREQALLQVRGALLLEAIADAEKIEVTDEDLQAEAARIAEELGAPLAKVQQQMRGKDAREALKNKVREDKALALLSSAANIQPA
ncbi:trigger factor [Anaeromyxobacter sp. Fw109-5]|uniref:Trigger factor n=1 Tax=Anaeromyxobacter sp. (strain Fw109-5) TaxID=404589 RepID=TIG_ANADF|nr:trigger factor [Anaeromyxobacter sp. Fw109-5]A7HFW0.1 RecName: Full=Trigger factor; Short=TF; AltName: Full=PPIase [Anaeromyxobacter sp. Fw109-5]ABS27606.1 trigger factor [Anaeromyxobacter sp. Fw109-5]